MSTSYCTTIDEGEVADVLMLVCIFIKARMFTVTCQPGRAYDKAAVGASFVTTIKGDANCVTALAQSINFWFSQGDDAQVDVINSE
jgi:hypothetical protein